MPSGASAGSGFEIYETSNAGTAQNTQMGWLPDVPGMTTLDGVATTDDGRSAWFRDTEGNFLCLTQLF